MLLKKVKIRLSILLALSVLSILAIFLLFKVLEDNVLYFYSPSEIKNSDDIITRLEIIL